MERYLMKVLSGVSESISNSRKNRKTFLNKFTVEEFNKWIIENHQYKVIFLRIDELSDDLVKLYLKIIGEDDSEINVSIVQREIVNDWKIRIKMIKGSR